MRDPSRAPHYRISYAIGTVCIALFSARAGAVVSSNGGANPPHTGIDINSFVGADQFYLHGYTGSRAVLATLEAGHIWNGHETLGHVTTLLDANLAAPNGDFDWHATEVGFVLGGRPGGSTAGDWQRGIAYGADLWSGAIAASWNPNTSGPAWPTRLMNFTPQSFQPVIYQEMVTGIGGQTADVINASWGFSGIRDNTAPYGKVMDALADQTGKTIVTIANNLGDTTDPRVTAPGSHFNSITAAALASDTSSPLYGQRASFSDYGPNPFFNPQTGISTANAVATVDLAAPGQNLTNAHYGGTTGGNAGGILEPGNNLYLADRFGTSFAAPIIAGGAALLVDVGKDRFGGGNAIDGRVIKSVLQNSATKTAGWNNGQSILGGVITTTQSLDYAVGAGRINLGQAYSQYTAGTTDLPGLGGGAIQPVGWDFGQVAQGTPTDYYFSSSLAAGTQLTCTLDWFIDDGYNFSVLNAFDQSLDNLDLEVWHMTGGVPDQMTAHSMSTFNNVEHLSFALSDGGDYMIRVKWTGEVFDLINDVNSEQFGLAWSAVPMPEPCALPVLTFVAALAARHRRGAG
jgi:hypothetical protein